MKSALYRLFLALAWVLVVYAGLSVLATFSQLADVSDRIIAGSGQIVFWGLVMVFAGLVAWPLWLWLRMPRMQRPPVDTSEPAYSRHQAWLRQHLTHHPDPQIQTLALRDDVPAALAELSTRADALIKQTAGGLFVSTALIQNGRLDSLLMLAAQLKLVWQIAALYHLRPTPAQITYLYGNVAATMLLSSQLDDVDFAELASPIVTSVAPSLMGAAPGLQGMGQLLVNSLANGAANAFLTLRVGLMAKAYCAPITQPEPQAVRSHATQAALIMLATLTREQGTRVAQGIWGGIKRQTGNALDKTVKSTRQAIKTASDTVTDSVVKTAQVAGSAATATGNAVASGVTEGGKAIVSGVTSATQAAGSVLVDTAKGTGQVVKSAGKATVGAAARLFERDKPDGQSPAPGTAGEQGSLL